MSRKKLIVGGGVALTLVVTAFVGVVVLTSSDGDKLTVYTARSHYGDERPFEDYADDEGRDLTLFGGSASELYERLESERENTTADVLITVDGANLYRAQEAGLLAPLDSEQLRRNVPASLRDPQNRWFGITTRARTVVRSKDRVRPDEITTYEQLGDPRWNGKLCLRSATSEYNVSLVADRIAKDGLPATERMLERWMANDPEILGSDTDVLKAIAGGRCDVGLTNSYYLGRELEDDPGFPVALVWADQSGRGTHVNVSGVGVVKGSDEQGDAAELVQFLTAPRQQHLFAANNHEFGVDEKVEPTKEIARFGTFKRDPIDVQGAGRNLGKAVQLMNQVGWN